MASKWVASKNLTLDTQSGAAVLVVVTTCLDLSKLMMRITMSTMKATSEKKPKLCRINTIKNRIKANLFSS